MLRTYPKTRAPAAIALPLTSYGIGSELTVEINIDEALQLNHQAEDV